MRPSRSPPLRHVASVIFQPQRPAPGGGNGRGIANPRVRGPCGMPAESRRGVSLPVQADPPRRPLRVGELRHDHPGRFLRPRRKSVHSSGRGDSDRQGLARRRRSPASRGHRPTSHPDRRLSGSDLTGTSQARAGGSRSPPDRERSRPRTELGDPRCAEEPARQRGILDRLARLAFAPEQTVPCDSRWGRAHATPVPVARKAALNQGLDGRGAQGSMRERSQLGHRRQIERAIGRDRAPDRSASACS